MVTVTTSSFSKLIEGLYVKLFPLSKLAMLLFPLVDVIEIVYPVASVTASQEILVSTAIPVALLTGLFNEVQLGIVGNVSVVNVSSTHEIASP